MMTSKFLQVVAPLTAILTTGLWLGVAKADDGAAGEAAWLNKAYPYFAADQAVRDVLKEFGHNLGLSIDVSDQVDGRLRDYRHDGSSGDFLDHLVSQYRLDWVLDRGRLFVSSADEQVDRSWSAKPERMEGVKVSLADAGFDDQRYPVAFNSGAGQITLSAPPRYAALVAKVVDRALAPRATHTVNVIHGRSRSGGS